MDKSAKIEEITRFIEKEATEEQMRDRSGRAAFTIMLLDHMDMMFLDKECERSCQDGYDEGYNDGYDKAQKEQLGEK